MFSRLAAKPAAMQRVTVSLDESLAKSFDELIKAQGYQSRSEAVRDLVRQAVDAPRLDDGYCVACLSYVYDHHTRSLGQRLIELQHDHHDNVVATTHVHLDHDDCLETTILKGPTAVVRAFADKVQAERGVRFVKINLVSVTPNDHHERDHAHTHGERSHLSLHRG